MITYGRSIEWRDRYGLQSVAVSRYTTPEEAFDEVLQGAMDSGWTPPRWWQSWRWSDTYWRWSAEERESARDAYRDHVAKKGSPKRAL